MSSLYSKATYFILFLMIVSCIEADIVQDEVVLLKITSVNIPEYNGSLSGLIGDEITLSAEGFNDRGISFIPDVTWLSTNESVAKIDRNGNVKLLGSGTTSVTAQGYGISSNNLTINVITDESQVARIEISSPKNNIEINETVQLTARAFDLNNNEVTGVSFTWISQDMNIASISEDGLITGHNVGSVIIQSQHENITGEFSLMVGESTMRTGFFTGLSGYDVSGNVTLAEQDDGNLLLILDSNFSTIDGPGLYIYLSNNADNVNGGYEVGGLKKNSGADTYSVKGITLNQYNYVFIHCKPFGVPFGRAELN